MLDIAEEIDAAIGAPPPGGPAVESTLALGRRALLRQRMAYGAGAAACALVVAGAAWSVSAGDAGVRTDDPGFGGGVSGSASSAATDPADPTDPTRSLLDSPPWHGEAARLDRQGRLEVKPGWAVTQDLSTRAVTAVEVSKGPRRMWYLFGRGVTFSPGGTAPGYASFQAWVDVNIPILQDMQDPPDAAPESGWPGEVRDDLVRFAPRHVSCCVLLPVDDSVRIVEERVNPDLPDSFATDADRSAVALVETDGERWYVLARDLPGSPAEFIAVHRSDGGVTLDVFLELAADRYAEGGGGLL